MLYIRLISLWQAAIQAGQEHTTQAVGEKLAREIGAHRYYECSAKSGEGVTELFTDVFNWFFSGAPEPPSVCCDRCVLL